MEKNYKIVIVDNDGDALDNLELSLKGYTNFQIIGFAKNGATAKKIISKEKPDLLFLDIELPNISGLSLMSSMRDSIDWDMHVVVYTAYDKYLLEALRESAFDFLLKPINAKELQLIMNRVTEDLKKNGQKAHTVHFQKKVDSLLPFKDKAILITTYTNEIRVLHLDNIGYFRHNQEKRQWEVVLEDSSIMTLKHNIKAEDILMRSSSFIQTHQSYIINLEYLQFVRSTTCLLFPPFDKEEIKISINYRKKLCDTFLCL